MNRRMARNIEKPIVSLWIAVPVPCAIEGVLLAIICIFLWGTTLLGCKDSEQQGAEGSPCYPNKTCDDGLKCYSGICVKQPKYDASLVDSQAYENETGSGSCVPSQEVCNGLDDDCDGIEDNGVCKIIASYSISCTGPLDDPCKGDLAMDGNSLWWSAMAKDVFLYKIDKDSGSQLDSIQTPIGYAYNPGLAIEGSDFWLANSKSGSNALLFKLDVTGKIVKQIQAPNNCKGLAYESKWLYAACEKGIYRIDPGSGKETFIISPMGSKNFWGLDVLNGHFWVIGQPAYGPDAHIAYLIDVKTKKTIRKLSVGGYARGIASNGTCLWIMYGGSGGKNKLQKISITTKCK